MTLELNDQTLGQFIQFLKNEALGLEWVQGATIIGQQKDGKWVLGKHLEITKNRDIVEENNRKYMWVEEDNLLQEITPDIKGPSIIPYWPHEK